VLRWAGLDLPLCGDADLPLAAKTFALKGGHCA
jgi:hypothetical protein